MKKLTTYDEAEQTTRQHTTPCGDCPWRKDAIPGWLGKMSIQEWLRAAHGESQIDCHTKTGPQCAGAAIYRSNVCKSVRDPGLLRLKVDRINVFTSPIDFTNHHSSVGKKSK